MSSKTESYHRNGNENTNDTPDTSDIEFFISSETPLDQIYNMLKQQNKSDKEIDSYIDKIKRARDKIHSVVKKYLHKIDTKYPDMEIPERMQRAIKYSNKRKLTTAQKQVVINHIRKGDSHGIYSHTKDLKYTAMSKFLGFDYTQGQMIKISPKDHSKLNELFMLYDNTKHVHNDVKTIISYYKDCGTEALVGKYIRDKHNVNISVHPIIAALFLPKIEYFERIMLYTNIARMVLSRGQIYLKNFNFNFQLNMLPIELDAEYELAYHISNDPNSLEYFKDDTPIENIIKRYRCQYELYLSVINFRQGRFYANGYNDPNDGVSGFLKTIKSYNWTFFDSPELFHVQDEGTILRKLLAVFSCRPTFTQLTSLASISTRYGLTNAPISTSLSRTTFINIPIINLKLPIDLNVIGSSNPGININLDRALYQMDHVIEHKIVVPKNKIVIYSHEVAFFYANRRFPSIHFNSTNMTLRCMAIPMTFRTQTSINKTTIDFKIDNFRIGRDMFNLRSVILIQRPAVQNLEINLGCSCAVVPQHNNNLGLVNNPFFFHYNPSLASIFVQKQGSAIPTTVSPISVMYGHPRDNKELGFWKESHERGTIFIYSKTK